MPTLKVRFDLSFTKPLVLYGFLPESEDQWLQMRHRDGRYLITASITDRSKQLENGDKLPETRQELQKHPALMCKGFTIEIEDSTPPPELMKSIEGSEWTEHARGCVLEMIDLAFMVHNGIVEYFRNMGQQSWLEPISEDPNSDKTLEFGLQELRGRWLNSEGKWLPLTVGQRSMMVRHRSHFMDGVDVEEWQEVATFVELFMSNHKRAPLLDVLIANSLQHLTEQNGRLAVIEAVIALEGVVKDSLSRVLVGVNSSQLHVDLLDELIHKAGLRVSVKVILYANADQLRIDAKDILLVLDAIDARNEIVHSKRRKLELDQAKEFVFAIRKVIARLRGKSLFRRAQGEITFTWK